MATLTERLLILITGDSTSGEAAFKKITGASKEAVKEMSVAQRATSMLGTVINGPRRAAAVNVGATMAALKIGEKLANSFASATSEVRAFQRVTGASATDASKLVAAPALP